MLVFPIMHHKYRLENKYGILVVIFEINLFDLKD